MFVLFFFFKQKTAYEMRISDWSSDVRSSDLSGCKLDGSAIIGRKIERATKKERADQEGPRGEPRLARAEVHEGCAAETGHGMDELDLRGEPEIPRFEIVAAQIAPDPDDHREAAANRKSTRLNSSH